MALYLNYIIQQRLGRPYLINKFGNAFIQLCPNLFLQIGPQHLKPPISPISRGDFHRTFEKAHHFQQTYILRRTGKQIPPLNSPHAFNDTAAFEYNEYLFEIVFGDFLDLGYIPNLHGTAIVAKSQLQHSGNTVDSFRAYTEHLSSSKKP